MFIYIYTYICKCIYFYSYAHTYVYIHTYSVCTHAIYIALLCRQHGHASGWTARQQELECQVAVRLSDPLCSYIMLRQHTLYSQPAGAVSASQLLTLRLALPKL